MTIFLRAAVSLSAFSLLAAPLAARAESAPGMTEQDEDDASCVVFSRITMAKADDASKPRLEATAKFFHDRLTDRHGAKKAQAMVDSYYALTLERPAYVEDPEWLEVDAAEQVFHRCEPQTR